MSHSEETTHYKLPLFVDDDTPTWLGDFNEAMSELDTSMKDVSDTNKELEAHVVSLSNRLVVDEKDIETNKNNIDANKQDIVELNTIVSGKAPIDHASDTTNYGIGNETLYGHVKLTDTVSADLDVNAGVSATPKMVNTLNDHVDDVFDTLNTHIENTDTAVSQAEANIKKLQDGKAPNNHASTGTTYGVGNASNYGHVKLTDSISSTSGASSNIAATPKMVQDIIKEWLTPTIVELPEPSSGSWETNKHQCAVYKLWKMLKFNFRLELSGTDNPERVIIGNCSDLGISKPSSDKGINSCIRCYLTGEKAQSFIAHMLIKSNGDICVDGWNTIGVSRVDWTDISSIPVMIDYSGW